MNGLEVVATTADPAFAVNPEGKILAWNAAAEYCLGYKCSEVLGRHCWRVLQGRDLSSNRYCGKNCPVRDMAILGEPVHSTQMLFRNAVDETTRLTMSTLVVRGEAGQEIVHLLQCLSRSAEETAAAARSFLGDNNANARLSHRQLEVLKHLSDGRNTAEIAEHLCISPATVRHHVQHMLRRLNVHSRLEAVALAWRIGLI